MPFVMLTGGAYTARSLTSAAQRCLNLFTEGQWGLYGPLPKPTGEPISFIHYCTPGLTLMATAPQAICRGLYTAYDGDLYACFGQQVLHLDQNDQWTLLGTLGPPSDPSDAAQRTTPVAMSDNGNILLVADGSVDGWFVDLTIPLASRVLHRIDRSVNNGWLGADTITYQDTFFVMNDPTEHSPKFYCSLSNITASNLTAAFSVFTSTLVTGGAGYTVGDVLTLTGTGEAQITINAVNADGSIFVPTGYGVTAQGALNVQPTNPVGVTGGTGTGATFDLTYKTNVGGFDPLDFAEMSAQADDLQAVLSVYRDLWLIGNNAYEVWINTGGSGVIAGGVATQTFPFALYQQGYGDWGTIAKYSVKVLMNQIFWLQQDKFGVGMVMMGKGFSAERISHHAIEYQISKYPRLDDAIGMTYQQQGHQFYVLTFPSANESRGATWVYDTTTTQWHERCFIDENGIEYRHLANAITAAYDHVFVGDCNHDLYKFDTENYTDNGHPIKRLRGFPHQIDLEANRRVMYHQVIAQMQTGSSSTNGPPVTFIDMPFVASNGTLLQNYVNINAVGDNVVQITPLNGVINNDALAAQSSGEMLYLMNDTPPSADYTVSFTMTPNSYSSIPPTGDTMFVIGRGNGSQFGYMAAIVSDGLQYNAQLSVMGEGSYWMPLGTLISGGYDVTLTMQGTGITMSVYRNADGMWMGPLGWQGNFVNTFSIDDNTYTDAGHIYIGGNWDVGNVFVEPVGVVASSAIGAFTLAPDVSVSLTLASVASTAQIAPDPAPAISTSPTITLTGVGSTGAASGAGSGTTGSANSVLNGVASGGVAGTLGITSVPTSQLAGVSTTSGIGSLTSRSNASTILVGVAGTSHTGAPASSISGIVTPPQALAAGFNSLVFYDDFNTATTIAPAQYTSSGYNWYWSFTVPGSIAPSSWTVNTTATAASVSNGNVGGGSNASPLGGVLEFAGGVFPNTSILTLPGWYLNNGSAVLPPLGQGHWGHCYFEAYIQFKIDGNLSTNPSNGWPAWWAWAAEALGQFGFGSSDLTVAAPSEVDFLESFGTIFGNVDGFWGATLFNHGASPDVGHTIGSGMTDNNWHTYGMLWTPGTLSLYFDNVFVSSISSSVSQIDAQSLFMTLGTGNSWPMNVDWVRVWQKGASTPPLAGDTTGVTAYRIADMLERFGFNLFATSSWTGNTSTNAEGSLGNYTTAGVTKALGWLTADATGTPFGSGLDMLHRCFGSYQSIDGQNANLEGYIAGLAQALPGHKFGMVAGGSPGAIDSIPYQIVVCEDSHSGTSPMTGAAAGSIAFAEGYNEPNNIGGQTAAETAQGQAEYGSSPVLGYSDIHVVGPSIVVGTGSINTVAGYISGYLGSNLSTVIANTKWLNVHLYPPTNPDFDDGSGSGGLFNEVYQGVAQGYNSTSPQIITEWHPTEYNPTHPLSASYDAYYSPMFILSAFRAGYLGYSRFTLYDYSNTTGYGGFASGVWQYDATTQVPRAVGYSLGAMYWLTGDVGIAKHTFSTTRLNYTVSGLPVATAGSPNSGGQTMLFQNSDGKFFLFVWNSQVDPGGAAVNVTVNFGHAVTKVEHYNITSIASNTPTPIQTIANAASIVVSLNASVHLLVITY